MVEEQAAIWMRGAQHGPQVTRNLGRLLFCRYRRPHSYRKIRRGGVLLMSPVAPLWFCTVSGDFKVDPKDFWPDAPMKASRRIAAVVAREVKKFVAATETRGGGGGHPCSAQLCHN